MRGFVGVAFVGKKEGRKEGPAPPPAGSPNLLANILCLERVRASSE